MLTSDYSTLFYYQCRKLIYHITQPTLYIDYMCLVVSIIVQHMHVFCDHFVYILFSNIPNTFSKVFFLIGECMLMQVLEGVFSCISYSYHHHGNGIVLLHN